MLFLSGEIDTFHEKWNKRENEILNIFYLLNITDGSNYSEKFNVIFDVCEGNKLATLCNFIWKKQSSKISVTNWRKDKDTLCSAKHLSFSRHVVTFDIHIVQLFRRPLTLLKLSITDSKESLEVLRLIALEVSCKSQSDVNLTLVRLIFTNQHRILFSIHHIFKQKNIISSFQHYRKPLDSVRHNTIQHNKMWSSNLSFFREKVSLFHFLFRQKLSPTTILYMFTKSLMPPFYKSILANAGSISLFVRSMLHSLNYYYPLLHLNVTMTSKSSSLKLGVILD